MTISFILPWYHKLEMFKRAAAFNYPVFAQPGCEVVIVLDEPSEEAELVKYLSSLPDVKWRVLVNDKPHPWRPPCKAINVGIRYAQGEWIAVLSPETVISLPGSGFLVELTRERKCFYTGHLRFVKDYALSAPFVPDFICGYGFMLCQKHWLEAVNGYAENREQWGGDDDDVQMRLQTSCGNKVVLPSIQLRHLKHEHLGPVERTEGNEPIGQQMPQYDWGRDFDRIALDWFKSNEVFDGRATCTVPWCCNGEVVQVQVWEAQAFRYMTAAPSLSKENFVCKNCRKELPATPKPVRIKKVGA